MMKHFLYAARHVFKWKANNIVKIIILSLGFALSALMLTRYAYDLTYDGFYPDSKQIYLVYNDYTIGEQSRYKNSASFAPLAPAMKEEFSGIQAATRFTGPGNRVFVQGNKEYTVQMASADKGFFDVFGYEFVKGDASRFAQPGTIFLSETTAAQLFGDKDPMDQVVVDINNNTFFVGAIFKDLPHNTSWDIEAVEYLSDSRYSTKWDNNDWKTNVVKLEKGTDPETISTQLVNLQRSHYDVDGAKSHNETYNLYLHPLDTHHQTQGHASEANLIIIILGFLILSISGLNFVLLTLSSLGSRSKEIGVRKCNGASQHSIFGLLFDESLIYCVIAMILGALFLFFAKPSIESITNGPLNETFSFRNLYATSLVALILLLLTSLIPGHFFASIPVTQVFRQEVQRRIPWKQGLLFIQLFATVFITSYLWMTIRQNNVLWEKGPGYTIDNIVAIQFKSSDISKAVTVRNQLDKFKPTVVKTSLASNIPLNYPAGGNVYEIGSDAVLVNSRVLNADNDFFKMYDIPLLAGVGLNNIQDTLNAVVSELFVEYAKWDTSLGLDNLIGHQFRWVSNGQERILTVSGICKDFHISHLKMEPMPVLITGYQDWTSEQYILLTAKVSEMDNQTLNTLTKMAQEIVPNSPIKAEFYSQLYYDEHRSESSSKTVMTMSAFIIGLITIIGIISYIKAELDRRRKEIAIRRINGGTHSEVLILVIRNLLYYTLAACLSASLLSYAMASNWLEDYAIKTTLPLWMYILSSLMVLAVVVAICILESIRILSENPIKFLKRE